MRYREKRRAEQGGASEAAGINLGAVFTNSVRDAFRKRQARHAATARGAGLSATRIEEIVVEDWIRRGLEPPKGIGMDLTIDLIARPPGVAEQARNQVRLGTDLLRLPFRLRRATRGGLGQLVHGAVRDRGRVFEIATGDEFVDVELGPTATAELDRLADQAVFLPSLLRVTKAQLRLGVGGAIEVWTYPGPDEGNGAAGPVGTIRDSDASGFRRLIAIAVRVGQPCIARAVVVRRRDGGRMMVIGRPLEP